MFRPNHVALAFDQREPYPVLKFTHISWPVVRDHNIDGLGRKGDTSSAGIVGCYAEDLAWVGALLERCPNFFVDISARIGELGRQPYTARRFFLHYADRILFGSDMGPDLAAYRIIYRFLETEDEYFNYYPAVIPMQGRWHVHGLYLPEEVLEKVYFRNAEQLFSS